MRNTSQEISKILHDVGGIIRVIKDNENRTYSIEDLKYINTFSISESFKSVVEFYGKNPSDFVSYPKYRDENGNVSETFIYIRDVFNNELESDFEKLCFVEEYLSLGSEIKDNSITLEEATKRIKEYNNQ